MASRWCLTASPAVGHGRHRRAWHCWPIKKREACSSDTVMVAYSAPPLHVREKGEWVNLSTSEKSGCCKCPERVSVQVSNNRKCTSSQALPRKFSGLQSDDHSTICVQQPVDDAASRGLAQGQSKRWWCKRRSDQDQVYSPQRQAHAAAASAHWSFITSSLLFKSVCKPVCANCGPK